MVIESASQIKQSISEYLKTVDKKYSLAKAYLFGSYANGTANEDSDIDIALISPGFSGDRFTDNVEVRVLTWGINTKIEAVAFRPEEFNENNLLASEILANGRELEIE